MLSVSVLCWICSVISKRIVQRLGKGDVHHLRPPIFFSVSSRWFLFMISGHPLLMLLSPDEVRVRDSKR